MFRQQFKYFNKFFVVGTITDMKEAIGNRGNFGVNVTVQTGEPGGFAHLLIPNNRNAPAAYDQMVQSFEIGSRVAVGFSPPQWLKLEQRNHNGKTYRTLKQFSLPELATVEQHNRFAGKITGELLSKDIKNGGLEVQVLIYDTDKDGNVIRNNNTNEEQFQQLTLFARDKEAERLYDVPDGSNVEFSVRSYNQLVRDDFGDIIDTLNEVRVEKFMVHEQQSTPQQPQVSMGQQTGAFNGATNPFGQTQQQSVPPSQQNMNNPFVQQQSNPFGQQQQQTQPNPFGQQQVPFPGAGQ